MAKYSVMEMGIRYAGIKQDCTDIPSATQGTRAEWNNSETLVQELCPDNSYGPRSQCNDLSAVIWMGIFHWFVQIWSWEIVWSAGHTNTHQKIAQTKQMFIFKRWWSSVWGFVFFFYDDALWCCTFSPKLPHNCKSLHIDDSFHFFFYISGFLGHIPFEQKSLYWVIPDLCSNTVS